MRCQRQALFAAALALILAMAPGVWAQYREYYVSGKIVDTGGQPIAGAELSLRDKATSRGYKMTTAKDGVFKFAGLPHGVYEVTVRKEGYAAKTDEWNFSTPQDRMQRIEVPPVTLVSEVLVEKREHAQKARAELADATTKYNQGDYDGAVASLTRLLEQDPRDANALYLLGLNHMKREAWPEAAEAFGKVAGLVPDFAGAAVQLGVLAKKRGDADAALGYFVRAAELDPKNADVFYNIGLIHFEQGRTPDALNSFERALSLKPEDPEFLEMVGRCYVNAADFVKAVQYLDKARLAITDPDKAKFLGELVDKLKEMIKKAPLPSSGPAAP